MSVALTFPRLRETDTLLPLLTAHPFAVYLVGGAVRDAVLGRDCRDFDFAVADQAVRLAFRVGDALDCPAYVLDRERDIGRVVLDNADQTTLDFARLRAADGAPTDDVVRDLTARDFTLNAMAIPIAAATATAADHVIDPTGGLADLQAGVLRMTYPGAPAADPVRVLRAARLVRQFDLRIDAETETAVRAAVGLLGRISAERLRDELLKLLALPDADRALTLLHAWGALAAVWPELAALEDVTQSPPHHEPVLAHTFSVLRWLTQIEALPAADTPPADPALAAVWVALHPAAPALRAHLERPLEGGVAGRLALRLGALFHDVGKAATRTVDADGQIHFYHHPEVGEPIAEQALRRLRLSNQVARHVGAIVRGHMRPLLLAQTDGASRRAVFRFFDRLQTAGLDICLLSPADHLAAYAGTGPAEQWERLLAVIGRLVAGYTAQDGAQVRPTLLLSGHDLMATFGLPPGPEIGRLLRLLAEEQAAGAVATREEALAFVRGAL